MNFNSVLSTPEMMDALVNSSVSAEDARIRSTEYAKMFSRNEDMKDLFGFAGNNGIMQKNFSGYSETPLLSTQYFNASVASYVSSFAGYLSIERDFDQPNGLFYWFDVLGISDLRSVIPNLGADSLSDIKAMGGFEFEGTVSTASAAYDILVGRKIIPGTVRIKITDSVNGSYELIDNGQGSFLAVAGKIEEGTINYLNGKCTFTLSTALTSETDDAIRIVGKEDVTGTPSNTEGASNAHANDKRFIAKMQQLGLATVPDMLVAEYNIASLGAMKKATGSDMATFLFSKLREMYTKMINRNLVTTLEYEYTGDTMVDLDMGVTTINAAFQDYRSRIDLFDAYLVNVESNLVKKAVKGVGVTAYLAGANAANQFQKGAVTGKWEKNVKMSYINDLLGWYDGIPVLRSTDIEEEDGKGTFYAIHKTQDGMMAPIARGIYMPLTDTPTIGNYNNPTQMAAGIYYQEGTKMMASELAQKVTFTMGF